MEKTIDQKFLEKNRENIEKLNQFIDNNLDDIRGIIVSIDLYHWLKLTKDYATNYENEEDAIKFSKYRNKRLLVDNYAPANLARFILKSAPKFEFNIPCICGIFNDEQHP